MTDNDNGRDHVLLYYDDPLSPWMRHAVATLCGDPDRVLSEGRAALEGMLDELPYLDRPDHSMADAIFACASMLAVFQVLRKRGIDEHAWGRAIHSSPTLPPGMEDQGPVDQFIAEAAASQTGGAPNEFVFEVLGRAEGRDFGMNINSCAICHLFGRHDAMDLVPYMCALDDAVSDKLHQGLRRTGTIALGEDHCDFRFKNGGEPLRLVEQFGDRLQLAEK